MLNKIKYLLLGTVLLVSCKKDFLDINTDPNNPTSIEVSKLLPTAQRALGDALALGGGDNGGLSQILSVYVHHISTREEADAYNVDGGDFFLGTSWPKLYATSKPQPPLVQSAGVLNNLEIIIRDATAAGNLRYAGIAKILKAYTYSQLVDVFGDVPFSEATKTDTLHPKFDDDAVIYPQLFTILDAGIADLSNTTAANILKPGVDDIIYNGDTDKWIRAANTIKLKLYTQIRKVKDVRTEVNALLAANKLIDTVSKNFMLPYGTNASTEDRNPGFEEYYSTQRSDHISPWFYEILKGYNTRIFTGNPDPRIPFYIYNQLSATQATREGNQTEYRDGAFVSIYFGSVGPDRDRTQQNSISVVGIYPVGGRYDEGDAQQVSGSSGTGSAPYKFVTYPDRLYLEAELIKEGLATGNARTKLQQAMLESFRQVDYIVTQHVKPAQTVPPIYDPKYDPLNLNDPAKTSPMMKYIHLVLAEYDAKPAQQLEIIMTQKWIAGFGSGVDAYSDYRRTGYPVLFNPNNPTMAPGGKVQPPINGDPVNPGAQKAVPVLLSRTYPQSLPWYSGELETNQNAPDQKNPATYKVFWIP
jgi:hypothetical protein